MNFYTFNLLYMFFAVYAYINFRMGMEDFLRYNKHSKTYIAKKQKGWRNYWFYYDIHKENNIGFAYYLNAAMLVLTALFSIVALCLGRIVAMRIPIVVLGTFLCIAQVVATVFAFVFGNRLEFGKNLVWFARKKHHKGFHTSVLDIMGAAVPVVFAVINVLIVF